MRRCIPLLCLLFISSSSLFSQIINNDASWPNAAWSLNGTYDATALLADPTVDANFSYDDDEAGSGSTDILNAESEVIDLTAANTGGETWLTVDLNYDYNLGDIFRLEWYDADNSTWQFWEDLPDNSSTTTNWCGSLSPFSSQTLDISGFTAGQLSGFQYRIHYDASSIFGWGFCTDSPILTSEAPPTCPDPSNFSVGSVTNNSADYSWTTGGAATGFLIEACPNSAPAGDVSCITSTTGTIGGPITLTGLTELTIYDAYITEDCGGANGMSAVISGGSFTTQADPPVCGGKFYDNGGPSNNYTNNADDDYLICPVNGGDVVTVTFNSFNTESGWDFLKIYDGDDNTAPALHTGSGFSGTSTPGPFISTAVSGCLFFNFDSDGGSTREGWDADVTCAPAPTCPDPTGFSVSSVAATTADYSWTTGGAAIGFTIEACPDPAVSGDLSCITSSTGSLGGPITLMGLSASTTYNAYVTEDCGASNGMSNTISTSQFTTPALPPGNDDCATALGLNVDALGACSPVTVDMSAALPDGNFSCDAFGINTATWYSFVAPNTGSVIITVTNGTQTGTAEGEIFDACGGNSEFCDGTINGETVSGLNPGSTYVMAIWYDVAGNGTIDICLEAGCGITDIQSVSNTPCNNNLYDATLTVTYANDPGTGMLEVTVGSVTQQFAIGTSPQTVTVTNCIADGNSTDVSAEFTDNTSCSLTQTGLFTAPVACACLISDISDPGNGVMNCNDNGGSNGTYDYQVEVTYSNAPGGEAINVTAGSGTGSIASPSTGLGPFTDLVTITGVPLDGASQSVTAEFATTSACTYTENGVFTNPGFCEPPAPVCGGKFFDPGGEFNDYPNNAFNDYLICPVNAGDIVTVTFNSFNTESGWDFLKVYDGDDNSAPALHTGSGFSGTGTPGPFTSTAGSGCLFFNFDSDGSSTREGWDADVTCAPPPTCPDPTDFSVGSITNNSADYSWTTGGAAIGFLIEACPNSAPSGDASCITTTVGTLGGPITLMGLSPSTAYDAYLTEDCGASNGMSNVIGPEAFTTLADPPSNDDCANSQMLNVASPGACTPFTADHSAATADGNFTCDAAGINIGTWYEFDAPSTGVVEVSITNGSQTGTAEGELFSACGTPIAGECYGTLNGTSISGLTSGTTYILAIWYDDFNTEGTFDVCLEAGCGITDIQSVSNTACNNNLYDATLTVTYANDPGTGMLEVTVGTVTQQFAIGTSPQTVTVNNCIADGASEDVSAEFTDNTACNISSNALFTAPAACECLISDISDPGNGVMNCDDNGGTNGTYDYQVEVTYANAPAGEALNITAGTGTATIASPSSGAGPFTEMVTIVGISLNGLSQSVTAEFALTSGCANTESGVFTNPGFCPPPVPVCGGKFFDPGGEFNQYGNNEDVDYLICPTSAGDAVMVTFNSFNTESGWDYLKVYNGDDETAPALHTGSGFSGTSTPGPFTSTSTSGCLFFNFDSDGSSTRDGWDADVSCSPCDATTNVSLYGGNTTLSTANTCGDGTTGFTYYSDGSSTYQFAIDWDPTNIGGNHNMAARDNVMITLTAANPGTAVDNGSSEGTWTMDRYWNISTNGNPLDGPVSIRFYYDPLEKSGTDNAATSSGFPVETSVWFKTQSVDFDPSQITATAVGQGAIDLTPNIVSDGMMENGVTYVEFANIASFSGGTYAAGAGTGGATALPIRLKEFDATIEGKSNKVTWTTSSAINVESYIVQVSNDGNKWTTLDEVEAKNGNRDIQYEVYDRRPQNVSYYRLKSLDFDGRTSISKVVKLLRETRKSVTVRPVPFAEALNIDLQGNISSSVQLTLTDMTGRVVFSQYHNVNEGANTLKINTSDLMSGIYILNIHGNDHNEVLKVMKR